LKRVEIAEEKMKTMSPKHAFWRIWYDLELQRKHETNVSKAFILALLETIYNCREKMKTIFLKHAFG